MNSLLARALLALLLLPGTVAFVVPLFLIGPGLSGFVHPVALVPVSLGVVLLLWCVRDFYVAGRGTLAPWSPPRSLVTTGPYRLSRNPMYVAVLLILCGWAAGFASLALWAYASAVAIAFHLRVLMYEEPILARTQAATWLAYKAQVPRWLGLVRRGDA
jgi:protein-S-isoprenylcysteine O-methyltransferase Ste14